MEYLLQVNPKAPMPAPENKLEGERILSNLTLVRNLKIIYLRVCLRVFYDVHKN